MGPPGEKLLQGHDIALGVHELYGVPQLPDVSVMTVVSMVGVRVLPSADVGQQLLVVIQCCAFHYSFLVYSHPGDLGPWKSSLGTTNTTKHFYWQAAPLSSSHSRIPHSLLSFVPCRHLSLPPSALWCPLSGQVT